MKSYIQPDFVDVQVEDTTQFDELVDGLEIHTESFDKDLDDVDYEPHETEYEEPDYENDVFGYYR